MKYPMRVLLSLLTLCTIGLGTNNVSAESNQCREIRAVRRLAIRENLDRDNLATLEYKYCGHSNLPSSSIESRLNSSEDCFNLTVMAELASMTEEGRKFVGMIKGLRAVTCKRPRQGQRSSLDWPNGKRAKWASNWYYPNGQELKFSDWYYYSNGEKFNWGSSWNYPNGRTAKLGSIWETPEGRSTSVDSLLTQGCSVVSTTECDRLWRGFADRILTEINRFDQNPSDENPRNDLLRHLGIIKLSWLSYQETNQSK